MKRRQRLVVTAAVALAALAAGYGYGYGATHEPPGGNSPDVPPAMLAALQRDLGLTAAEARTRLAQQDEAHRVLESLPHSLRATVSGYWFDATTGKLTVAVTSRSSADAARESGAEPKLVTRSRVELDRLVASAQALAGESVIGLNGYGVDVVNNDVLVTINRTKKNAATKRFLDAVRQLGAGVRVVEVKSSPVQQAGEVNPGDPWWPGSETNCSVGFGATDSSGGKHFLTAGHCANNADQPAYGESGQRNRIGTSNVGGNRYVNGREGDMGVVAVTEPGWTLSAAVNTWGQPAITVSGSKEAIVNEAVCHSGNTAPNFECGRVTKVNHTMDYGSVVVEGLTVTTACSQSGDSGGAWLSGDKAVGLHEGAINGNNCPSGDNAVFQPVNEALAKWGLTLVTGASPTPTPTQSPTASPTASPTVSPTVSPTTPPTSSPPPGTRTFSNETDYPIRDYTRIYSPVTSTVSGQAASSVKLSVTISHTCAEDLGISLVAPDGTLYAVKYSGGYYCTPWNGTKAYTVNGVNEAAGGTWQLRVTDYGPGDTGTLQAWYITL